MPAAGSRRRIECLVLRHSGRPLDAERFEDGREAAIGSSELGGGLEEYVAQYIELFRAHVTRHIVRVVERVPEDDLRARRLESAWAHLAVKDTHLFALERKLGEKLEESDQQRFCRVTASKNLMYCTCTQV